MIIEKAYKNTIRNKKLIILYISEVVTKKALERN
jgi:hypothetical protein